MSAMVLACATQNSGIIARCVTFLGHVIDLIHHVHLGPCE
jgi:hypothetical protein